MLRLTPSARASDAKATARRRPAACFMVRILFRRCRERETQGNCRRSAYGSPLWVTRGVVVSRRTCPICAVLFPPLRRPRLLRENREVYPERGTANASAEECVMRATIDPQGRIPLGPTLQTQLGLGPGDEVIVEERGGELV